MVKKISSGTNFIIAIDNIIKTNQNTVNIHEMPNIIYVNNKCNRKKPTIVKR